MYYCIRSVFSVQFRVGWVEGWTLLHSGNEKSCLWHATDFSTASWRMNSSALDLRLLRVSIFVESSVFFFFFNLGFEWTSYHHPILWSNAVNEDWSHYSVAVTCVIRKFLKWKHKCFCSGSTWNVTSCYSVKETYRFGQPYEITWGHCPRLGWLVSEVVGLIT